MKIATFNINGINRRWESLEAWLTRERPEVACLQELKAPQESFPAAALRELGYEAIWHGQQHWNGVAILSRIGAPIQSRRGLPGDATDKQSRYIEAAVNGVVIACLYAPNGNPQPGPKFAYKLAWMRRLEQHVSTLAQLPYPVVLAGDFNVVPTDFDIYDTRSWKKDALLQPESRAAYCELLAQGWTDTIRALHPEDRIYTFWSYFRNRWPRNAGLRIDHLLTNATAARRVIETGVDTWVRALPEASDHAPTWMVLSDEPVKAAVKRKVTRTNAPAKRKVTRTEAPAKRKVTRTEAPAKRKVTRTEAPTKSAKPQSAKRNSAKRPSTQPPTTQRKAPR